MPAHPLDYRQHYGNPHGPPAHPGYQHQSNPMTGGQMIMIAAGALALGGLSYWGWQAKRRRDAEKKVNGGAAANDNPGHWRRAA